MLIVQGGRDYLVGPLQWDGWAKALGTNRRPTAPLLKASTAAGAARTIDLAPNTQDADGDTLSYSLPYAATSLGGSVSLAGSVVTYTPPAGLSQRTDHFVYVATDGKGGVDATVVAVDIL